MRTLKHALGVIILVFFVASFFIGIELDPTFTDIAASPYGLFSYLIITILTAFIPSLATLPMVTTATFIWGPWVAGGTAVIGWTIGGVIEYVAAYYAIDALMSLFNGGKKAKDRMAYVQEALTFWRVFVARLFIPPFIFGLVKTKFSHYFWASMLAYVPLAAVGVVGGELLKGQLEDIQPLLLGGAFALLILTIDYFFIKKEEHDI